MAWRQSHHLHGIRHDKTIAITITNKHTRQSDNNGNNGDKRINKGSKMNIAPLDAMTISYWNEEEE